MSQSRGIPFLLFLSFILSGCLVSEVTEYKISLNREGTGGTFTTIMRNVESDSPDSVTQRKDFENLLANWKGDKFLLDEMEKGLYVKDRKLFIERGKLVWRESAIFANLATLIPDYDPEKPLRFPLSDTSGQKILTNGTLTTVMDTLFIVWPPHTRTFTMKTIQRSFTPQSRFARLFRDYRPF